LIPSVRNSLARAPECAADALAISAVSLVRNDQQPELTHSLLDPLAKGELILNLRAEAAPELLEQIVRLVVADWRGPKLTVTKLESFRPAQPKSTQRTQLSVGSMVLPADHSAGFRPQT
jgi:hypothetical protein